MIKMQVKSIKINDIGDRQFIVLTEVDGPRSLTIVIGYGEARAIDRFLEERRLPRPMTHDLVAAIIEAAQCSVEHVHVTELKDGTFFALIRLQLMDGSIAEVDARPSDAIALATSVKAPIYVAEDVLMESMTLEF